MSDQQLPACKDDQHRRADILAHPDPLVNGIDFVEVDAADHRTLRLYFIRPVAPANSANPNDPDDVYGLSAHPERFTINGGVRIVGIKVLSVKRQVDPNLGGYLELTVDNAGDFSNYTLAISGVPQLDPILGHIDFSFMAACPVDVDCPGEVQCPPPHLSEPLIDYEAKDFSSFRQMLLDMIPSLNPGFTERNPADLGIALVELLAYQGDYLSYFQDAVANEAYLDTLRHRISARRLTKLIDYRMHDGRNAWTFVHAAVNAKATLAMSTVLLTRITVPLKGQVSPPDLVIDGNKITSGSFDNDPALRSAVVFETTHAGSFDPVNNEIWIHTWGNEECCVAPGVTEAYLYSVDPLTRIATRPSLKAGDYLLFEEVKGPLTGAPADADPTHREVVRIDTVDGEGMPGLVDPLYSNTLIGGALQRFKTGLTPLPLLHAVWRKQDALQFPMCISAKPPAADLIRNISVARGNIVLADHGRTLEEAIGEDSPVPAGAQFGLKLSKGPVTERCAPTSLAYDPVTGRLETERFDLTCDVRTCTPEVSLRVTFENSPNAELWTSVRDLLESSAFDSEFVVEIDDNGQANLRFGDGEYGRTVEGAIKFDAVYRIGNGTAGNVGAESIAHVVLTGPGGWLTGIRNPLAASGGVDPETIEETRQLAPQAFRAEQFRAVTESDYAAAALKLSSVAGAVASFRWTGSWYTVFAGIDPADPSDLIYDTGGGIRLSAGLETSVTNFLTGYRLAGYDLEIRPPQFVPVDLAIDVCVSPGYFRTGVATAVILALSNRILPDGSKGFFHPSNFTFAESVYLSRIYAAVEKVQGVDSAVVTRFRRYGQADNGELASGVLPIGAWEIAQLDNDPNFLEHGVLQITALGGKG